MELQLTTRAARTAATSLAVALVLSVGGCGTETAPVGQPELGADLAETTGLLTQWWGTRASAQAAEVVVAHAQNGPYDTCLEEKGYPRLDWRTSIFPAAWTAPLSGSTLLLDENSTPFTGGLVDRVAAGRIEAALNKPPGRGREEIQAENTCLETTRAELPSDDEIEEVRRPASLVALQEKWTTALAREHEEIHPSTDVVECVDALNLPELKGKSLQNAGRVAHDLEMELSISTGSEKALSAFREWESVVVSAIIDCTAPYRSEAEAAASRLLEEFNREHAGQVKELTAHWAEVRGQAAELGWSESEPYAGHKP